MEFQYHGIPWNFKNVPWNSMESHETFLGKINSSMKFHGTQEYGKNAMEFHGTLNLDKIPWNSMNLAMEIFDQNKFQ